DSPRLGFCFDNGHHNARDPQTADLFARFGHRLMALHLHDNEGYLTGAGEEDQHRLPFDGTTDWPARMRAIAATGYNGPTSLEVVHDGDHEKSPSEFLALAFERAARLEALRNA
ncbi:MAG: sugar phosphate isomerase/epimerase, partial [Kiritimatiellaeota bacterium]|nr:sugar phosphate isomerase/epimerase [Kiritimatiellota bacterium]